MKKTENKDTKKYNLCCLTNIGNVFFANTTNRAKLQYYDSKSFLQREYSLFTESILLR